MAWARPRIPQPKEEVEVYHMRLWYDAVVLRARPISASKGPAADGPRYEAFVHFQGWAKRHDSWVHCSRVRPPMIGTNEHGAEWMRDRLRDATIQTGLLIEVRMDPQWLPAEIIGTAGAAAWKAKLDTDGSVITVGTHEIIKRWDIPPPASSAGSRRTASTGAGDTTGAVPSGAGKPASSQPAEEAATKPAPPARRGSKRRAAAPQSAPARPKKQKVASRVPDLFCTCQQKADPNRDWIGCRQCLGWFHPECVGLTAAIAERLPSSWVCNGCLGSGISAGGGGGGGGQSVSQRQIADVPDANGVIVRRAFEKPVICVESDLGEGDRYCICRRSYSVESTASTEQNFLQCEFCAEWFHFECLGVTEEEVEAIEQFKCPRCTSLDDVLSTKMDPTAAAAAAAVVPVGQEQAQPVEQQLTDHEYYIACTAQVSQASELESMETCLLCCGSGDPDSFIYCTQCGESFHSLCLNQQLSSRKKFDKIRSRWRCLSCMRCSICEDGTDDNLVVCDVCDRGFHLECIRPAISQVPEGSWVCTDCVQCLSCGVTTPGKSKSDKWHQDYTLCTPCSQLYDKKQYCPVCLKCYQMDSDERMVGCDKCGMWVHTDCDGIDDESYKRLGLSGAKYFCITCREGKGSKRKDIAQFKKNMRWLSKRSQQRFRDEQTSKVANQKKRGRELVADSAGTGTVKRSHDPPTVTNGTINMLRDGTKKLRPLKTLPSEQVLRTWTIESQHEFWLQRRRFWDKDKLQGCQRACKAKRLWAGGDKQDIVIRLTLSEFHAASLQPQDHADFDASAVVDIVIPDATDDFGTNSTSDAHSNSAGASTTDINTAVMEQTSAPSAIERAQPIKVEAIQPVGGQLASNYNSNYGPPNYQGVSQWQPLSVPLQQLQIPQPRIQGSTNEGPSPKSLSTLQALLEMSGSTAPMSSATSAPVYSASQASATTMGSVQMMMSAIPNHTAAAPIPSGHAAPSYLAPQCPQPKIDSSQHAAARQVQPLAKAKPRHITFQVQLMEGKILKIKASDSTVISKVKHVLHEPSGIEPMKQRLLHAGESLIESRTLGSYHFTDNSVISVDTVLSSSDSDDEVDSGSDVSASEEEGEDAIVSDLRKCALCHKRGDRRDEGRLLPAGYDVWVHTNCAVWSAETYEDEHGQLHNLGKAISRGQTIKCDLCKRTGATVGCCTSSCTASFHFKCAIRARCLMLLNKQVYCAKHKKKAARNANARSMSTSRTKRDFEVKRKIFLPKPPSINTLDKQLQAYVTDPGSRGSSLGRHVGSFTLRRPGKVVFDCPAFHDADAIYPVDYFAVRRFWSTTRVGERCPWRLEILRGRGGQFPVFRATCSDSGDAFFGVSSTAVWDQVMSSVVDTISGRGTGKSISADDFFGLSKFSVREIIERLPESGSCRRYRFRTIPRSNAHSACVNDSGCARSEASTKEWGSAESKAGLGGDSKTGLTLTKNVSSGASSPGRRDSSPTGRRDSMDGVDRSSGSGRVNMLPDIMQYRQMKVRCRTDTYVRNSQIHSLGLFATNAYDAQQMVIEYTGDVVRQQVADKREHEYLQRGIACYLFALDDQQIIDSSMKGNSARFINHCCDPNCTARVMNLDGAKRIIFSTLQEIAPGEEFTYDYKFAPDSDPAKRHTIPCNCGAAICRKWLN